MSTSINKQAEAYAERSQTIHGLERWQHAELERIKKRAYKAGWKAARKEKRNEHKNK